MGVYAFLFAIDTNRAFSQIFGPGFATAFSNFHHLPNSQLFSNPGDYVWGSNFENILNQLFHSGGSDST